jgi:Zn-dependent peptidase ImmA (M78 family)
LTKSELAEQIGVELRSVSAYESGMTIPREDTLDRIVSALKFPRHFFSGDDLETLDLDSVSFRSMSKMTACQRDMAMSQGQIALHFNKWVVEEWKFDLPSADLPDLSQERSPEAAAETLRRHWGIGALSIRNMIHLMEARGVRIFSLAVEARELDAFSMWKDRTPFVFLNTQKTSEHSRYDAAHELGHLVLHRHATPHGRGAEHEADLFASAFLMPKASVIAHVPRYPSFADLVRLKKIWTVSVAALNRRLFQVEMISEWQYRMLCIQISQYGRDREPEEAPRETSQVLPKIFSTLYSEERLTRASVASALSIPRSELEQLMFGLAMASIDGGGKSSPNLATRRLQLVGKN